MTDTSDLFDLVPVTDFVKNASLELNKAWALKNIQYNFDFYLDKPLRSAAQPPQRYDWEIASIPPCYAPSSGKLKGSFNSPKITKHLERDIPRDSISTN